MELNNSNHFSTAQNNAEIINFQALLVGYKKKVLCIGENYKLYKILNKQDCDITEFGVNLNDNLTQNSIPETSISDLEYLDFKKLENKKFDIVFVGNILLTLKKPKQFFKNISSFLNKNGYMVCSLPNITNASSRINFLNGYLSANQFSTNTSNNFLTISQALIILSEIHFSVAKLYRVKHDFFPQKIDWNKDFGLPIELIESILTDPEANTSNYIFKVVSSSSVNSAIRKSLDVFHNDVVTKKLRGYFTNYKDTILVLKQTIKDKDDIIQSLVEQTFPDEDVYKKYKSTIENLYKELLQRPVDIYGFRYYGSMLESGKVIEDVRKAIIDSEEYKNLHSDVDHKKI